MKINYISFTNDKSHAADKRRFYIWSESLGAKRHKIEIIARNGLVTSEADLTIAPTTFNLHTFLREDWPPGSGKKILHLVDGYGLYRETHHRDLLRSGTKFIKGELTYFSLSYSKLIRKAIAVADAVICASPEQSKIISELNPNVFYLPDNHSFFFGRSTPSHCVRNSVTLLWEGLPESLSSLFDLGIQLSKINKTIDVNLLILTNLHGFKVGGAFFRYDVTKAIRRYLSSRVNSLEIIQWSESSLLKAASYANIALLPVNVNSELHRLKHESRLLLYWQLGLPVACSAIPSYIRVTKEANLPESVFHNPNEFYARILSLSQHEKWTHNVNQGRRYLEQNHTMQIYQSKWNDLLLSLVP